MVSRRLLHRLGLDCHVDILRQPDHRFLDLARLQIEDKRITNVEARVAALEAMAGASNSGLATSTSANISMESVLDYLSGLGANITASVASFTDLLATSFTVGSAEKPAGI